MELINLYLLVVLFLSCCVNGTASAGNWPACNATTSPQLVTDSPFLITSPNYPEEYPNNSSCQWLITAPTGHNVEIVFENFKLETSDGCKSDSVKLYDGSSQKGSSLLAMYCGEQTESIKVTSNGTAMFMAFVSDHSGQLGGFTASGRYINTRRLACSATSRPEHVPSSPYWLESPQFPKFYPSDSRCEWVFTAPTGHIWMKWVSFRLEQSERCDGDYVQIYDGDSYQGTSLGRFCGTQSSMAPLVSSSKSLLVVFVSDYSQSNDGFQAIVRHIQRVSCVIDPCKNGGTCHDKESGGFVCDCMDGYKGAQCQDTASAANWRACNSTTSPQRVTVSPFLITSPNYPEEYPENSNCEWLITAPTGFNVEIVLDNFKLESGVGGCKNDYVKLYDGSNQQGPLLAIYCGEQTESIKVTSNGTAMFMVFVSDHSGQFGGFRVSGRYKDSGRLACSAASRPQRVTGSPYWLESPQFPKVYPSNSHCEWVFTAPTGHIWINWTRFHLEQADGCTNDYVHIYDGNSSHGTKSLGRFCGTQSSMVQFVSSATSLFVEFVSDQSKQADGFKAVVRQIQTVSCAIEPCQHGGTCRDEEGGFVCDCMDSFKGEQCQDVFPCSGQLCSGHGTCIPANMTYRCECGWWHDGKQCESVARDLLLEICGAVFGFVLVTIGGVCCCRRLRRRYGWC